MFIKIVEMFLPTLVYWIAVWDKINVEVGKLLKHIKRADQNKAMQGGIFFSK